MCGSSTTWLPCETLDLSADNVHKIKFDGGVMALPPKLPPKQFRWQCHRDVTVLYSGRNCNLTSTLEILPCVLRFDHGIEHYIKHVDTHGLW